MALRTTKIGGREFNVGDILKDEYGEYFLVLDYGMIDFQRLRDNQGCMSILIYACSEVKDSIGMGIHVTGDVYKAKVLGNVLNMIKRAEE